MEKKDLQKIIARILELPEIVAGKDLWQNEFHEYDVYTHTIHTGAFMKRLVTSKDMIVAAYLHDIGKPASAKIKYCDGIIAKSSSDKVYHKFRGHEKIGEKIIKEMSVDFFREYDLDKDKIASVVGSHYLTMRAIKDMGKASTFDEFLSIYKKLDTDLDSQPHTTRSEILCMFLADKLGQGKTVPDIDLLFFVRDSLLTTSQLKKESMMKEIYCMQKHIQKKPVQ